MDYKRIGQISIGKYSYNVGFMFSNIEEIRKEHGNFDLYIKKQSEQVRCSEVSPNETGNFLLSDVWRDVEKELPDKSIYDWVLVQYKMVPEGYYGVPHIAELRKGVWYADFLEEPLENCLSVKVTHWMPLPPPPNIR